MRELRLILAMAIAASLQWISSAAAQDWPTRPVTMVVAFPAGGADDILGRIVAARLSELLGQPVNVENVGGAGGMTTSRVAKAAPDGYQIALGTSATHAVSQAARKTPLYDSIADFTPVALIGEQPFVLIARNDLPASGLQEFITYAKANDTKMQYGSAGVGSATQLVCALLDTEVGVQFRHVSYHGDARGHRSLV